VDPDPSTKNVLLFKLPYLHGFFHYVILSLMAEFNDNESSNIASVSLV
jgi:hypothetical protein